MSNTQPAYDDTQKIPRHIQESFHTRIGKPPKGYPEQKKPANEWGYPVPGVQSPSAVSVMAQDYFVSQETWANILDHGDFDYIVVGSGISALAFITEALRLDKTKKILCLERGDFWLPTHFQNLPLPFKMVLGGASETFPFTLSRKTFETPELKYVHGSCPFFGGRSTFWSAWCPRPTEALMRAFPKSMIDAQRKPEFWRNASELLNVTMADDIDNTVFGILQRRIDDRLKLPVNDRIPSADISEPAHLAVGRKSKTSTVRFNKFSVPGPMLGLFESQRELVKKDPTKAAPLELMVNCTVNLLEKSPEDSYVRVMETDQGMLSWSGENTKIILCAGAFPNATILLNSFPEECKTTVGHRVTGHFLTHIAARVPVDKFGPWEKKQDDHLEIAAHYLAGTHPETKKQYHVQITAIHSPHPEEDAVDAARECPDYAAAATLEQLRGSEKHVVFVCATLGEFTENNPNSHLKKNKGKDLTTNVTLQYTLADEDRKLWDLMDVATYETIAAMAGAGKNFVEYWDEDLKCWAKPKPPVNTIRIPGIVHEASTCYVGPKDKGGSLDDLYRPHGIQNVFVAGACTFPTAGSWNPTLTLSGYAQDLARRLQAGEDLQHKYQ